MLGWKVLLTVLLILAVLRPIVRPLARENTTSDHFGLSDYRLFLVLTVILFLIVVWGF